VNQISHNESEHDTAVSERPARWSRVKPDAERHLVACAQASEAQAKAEAVGGDGGCGKANVVNAGDLPEQDGRGNLDRPAEVRAAVVAQANREASHMRNDLTPGPKSGNTDGAKGGRKANNPSEREPEEPSAIVPRRAGNPAEEDRWQRCRAERGVWSEGMLLALERGIRGNRWFSMIDKIYAERTLEIAWGKVRANAGACGIDGIKVEHFEKDSQKRLLAVREQLIEGTCQPQSVKRVWIPKLGSSEKRPLGIPTVRDRIVQTALRMVIEPIFEREFAPQSYGFRPGRSCKDALRRVEGLLQSGQTHVVDIDIRGYFDHIPHAGLMALVRERIADRRVLALVEAFLHQSVIECTPGSEERIATEAGQEGTPQGGVISPLLANICLNPLDWLLQGAGVEMVRYADDIVVLCQSRAEAVAALERIQQWMTATGLTLHPEKTQIVDMDAAGSHFDFLGYRFRRNSNGRISRLIRPKSLQKLRARIKPLTQRTSGHSMEAIAEWINPILRGWYGYFKHAAAHHLKTVDTWLRKRLRSILRKRRKKKGCSTGRDNLRWRNCYFADLGLFCLEETKRAELNSLHHGASC
jgi:RNA-directed DNA polymerase